MHNIIGKRDIYKENRLPISPENGDMGHKTMQKIARKHGMVCLLHEKPFDGVNGSGKHNNWSISTDTGVNLLEPGDTPYENAQFLLFLCAIIKAVDEYQDLLRISVASAGNDHRLGANEAPPAIVSIFLGDELTGILKAIETDTPYGGKEKELMKIGVHILPKFPKDTTDRNRTSPFAFTGNKFEFRMLGSSQSISGPNVVLNTIVAEELKQFADELEGVADFEDALNHLIKKTIKEHKRIIFNGNGYDESWITEAEQRGLLNLKCTPECLPYFLHEKNIRLFTEHGVFSKEEMESRYEILMENYCKVINIEARTMAEMVKKEILPAVSEFSHELAETIQTKKAVGADDTYESATLEHVDQLLKEAYFSTKALEDTLEETGKIPDITDLGNYYHDGVFAAMSKLRESIDELETITSKTYWPYPSYGHLLFGIR